MTIITVATAATFSIILAHFVGDFVLQSDWMAQNKSKSLDALAAHVAVYSVAILIPMAFLMPVSLWWWWPVNVVAHFCTDAVTSRISSYYWRKNRRHAFFITIGADQTIHYLTLLGTWSL